MGEGLSKIIYILAGVAAAIMLVVGLMAALGAFSDKATDLTGQAMDSIDSVTSARYEQYDGKSTPGTSVQNLIKELKGDDVSMYVLVKTKMNTSGVYYICNADRTRQDDDTIRATLKDMRDDVSANYINPTKKFYGEVIKNENGAIIGIEFTQE